MKNTKKLWLAIAVILAIGFVVTSCDNGEGACTHTGGAAATCTTAQTCTKCGNVMQGVLGHQGLTAAFAATCTAAGNSEVSGTCTRSGCEQPEVIGTVIGALGHQGVNAVAATCTEDGNTGTGTCERCEEVVAGTVINALGHQGLTAAFAATCTAAGNSEVSGTCTRCEEVVAGVVINALGHQGLTAVAATCIEDGDTGTGTCTRCEETVTGTVISALGHATWVWSTYNATTGKVSCAHSGCTGDFAALGDTGPGGGKIFYVTETGFTHYENATDTTGVKRYYLESTTADTATTLAWASSDFANTNIAGTNEHIGTGLRNTLLILGIDADAPAALACRNYSNNSLTDWFLPSRAELIQLYTNRAYVGVFPVSGSSYWSSSQNNSTSAFTHVFGSGVGGNSNKINATRVRPIRAF